MIIITIKMEAEKTPAQGTASDPSARRVNVFLKNTQAALDCNASLRAGESVEHRLRLDATGVIELHLSGWSK
jgi:hypothetical protein